MEIENPSVIDLALIKKLLGNPRICSTGDLIIPKRYVDQLVTALEAAKKEMFVISKAAFDAGREVAKTESKIDAEILAKFNELRRAVCTNPDAPKCPAGIECSCCKGFVFVIPRQQSEAVETAFKAGCDEMSELHSVGYTEEPDYPGELERMWQAFKKGKS